MVFWILLFFLIIAISFVLAYLSMRDFQDIPHEAKVDYGLFLIRTPQGFNTNYLDLLGRALHAEGLLFSIERLFKGNRGALTIFGPKNLVSQLSPNLNLLELEDYADRLLIKDISVWEMGVKNPGDLVAPASNDIFNHVSSLGQEDQFFWQVVLDPRNQGENLAFQTQVRAAIYSNDSVRKQSLINIFQNLKSGALIKVPKPFSLEMMVDFYSKRSLGKDSNGPILTSEGVINLLKL